jgi:tartrate-resistant acid phosphatase type 5
MHFYILLVPVALGSSPLFTAFGDWGDDTKYLAQTIEGLKAQPRPRFVALLGDNFYSSGVQSVDDPKFALFDRFSSVSDRFLVVLGNHDYGYAASVKSEIAYWKKNPKWIMPSRYFLERMYLGNGYSLCAIVLDTHVFDSAQQAWFEQQLISCQQSRTFRIVFTHYPMLTVGVYATSGTVSRLRDKILPLIERYKVHAYLSGHEHQMQAFERLGTHFLISGATAQRNRNAGNDLTKWTRELRYLNAKDVGFASFYLSWSDPSVLTYRFINALDGSTLYQASLRVGGDSESPVLITPVPQVTPTVPRAGKTTKTKKPRTSKPKTTGKTSTRTRTTSKTV